jgi:hypothetical protein
MGFSFSHFSDGKMNFQWSFILTTVEKSSSAESSPMHGSDVLPTTPSIQAFLVFAATACTLALVEMPC